MNHVEATRLAVQSELDTVKTRIERNRLGQFATPTEVARDVLALARQYMSKSERIRFLDPAVGTGSFFSALKSTFSPSRIAEAVGYEIDRTHARAASDLWAAHGLSVKPVDFTTQKASPNFNLLVCNPPYVRHHHLTSEEKERLQGEVRARSGMQLSGLAGLYCHFMGLSHGWMADNGIAVWLVPSEFMDVNYGEAVKSYLRTAVTLLHVHRFDPNDVQFADALVSSAIVVFRKSVPPPGHEVRFTFGGSPLSPHVSRAVTTEALSQESKWTRLSLHDTRERHNKPTISDFFNIRRGLATGNNDFFILTKQEITEKGLPLEAFRPILPSPRYLLADEIPADDDGNPELESSLFLLDIKLAEHEIKRRYPRLFSYLESGKKLGIHEGYLCSHRAPWYAQENRPAAPFVCSYIGRSDNANKKPFRFILNHSRATVTNGYLAMYPTGHLAVALAGDPSLARNVWKALLQITSEQLLSEGRVYGGGLHKLEPKELAKVDATSVAQALEHHARLIQSPVGRRRSALVA